MAVNPQMITLIITSALSVIDWAIKLQKGLNQPVDPVLLAEREKLRKALVDQANDLGEDDGGDDGDDE